MDGVSIYQCLVCSLAFVNPKTDRKEISHIYSFSDYQKRELQFIKRFQKTIKLLKTYSKGKKVLEVGAGFGLFSSMLLHEGYEVEILEPDVTSHYLKDLPIKVHRQYLEAFVKTTHNKFDIIILYDVLEHVNDPNDTVAILSKLLSIGGVVFIQTPNYQSLMSRIVRSWSWWMVEDHRFFFSKKSLRILFEKKIWKKLYYSTYEDWEDFKKNLDGNFNHNRFGKYLFFSFFIPLYFSLRTVLWKCGWGGLMVMIYQKR